MVFIGDEVSFGIHGRFCRFYGACCFLNYENIQEVAVMLFLIFLIVST